MLVNIKRAVGHSWSCIISRHVWPDSEDDPSHNIHDVAIRLIFLVGLQEFLHSFFLRLSPAGRRSRPFIFGTCNFINWFVI
mmetsp:Transcript_24872/g.38684  ORF Transcript_24872/g.38684 Transcript_24872/m.38684 type:complete len:81 (+) Transcript_24872:576-818(+)